ncbi:hypothetical protein CPT_Silence49 [Bacillus phage Silence]|jgi:hypothetical protein|nr:hypothetical protein CPT_Silence49 [Bacillus phage Silence]
MMLKYLVEMPDRQRVVGMEEIMEMVFKHEKDFMINDIHNIFEEMYN